MGGGAPKGGNVTFFYRFFYIGAPLRPIFLFFGFAREKSFVTVAKSPCTDVHGHDHGLGN